MATEGKSVTLLGDVAGNLCLGDWPHMRVHIGITQ